MGVTDTAVRRPSVRMILARLPVVIGAAILVVPWFFLTWNVTVAQAIPALRFRSKPIAGMVSEEAPNLTLGNLTSYKFQTYVSHAVGTMTPIYKPAIHWKNQIYYSVFAMSGMPGITVGRNGQLLQKEYLDEFCARDLTRYRPEAEAWAHDIRRMQDFFEARGTRFLYVITPSKPAVYPGTLPAGFACPARPFDQQNNLAVWHEIIDRLGIHYVDTATVVAEAKSKYDISMFPRGGIHWNMLAASLGAQAVTDKLNAMFGSTVLTPFTISWQRSHDPQGSDRDLLDMLNLVWPDKRYEVPMVTLHPAERDSPCKPLRITEVGGSFLFEMDDALSQVPCPPAISNWFYWSMKHFIFPGGTSKPLAVDPEERKRALLSDL